MSFESKSNAPSGLTDGSVRPQTPGLTPPTRPIGSQVPGSETSRLSGDLFERFFETSSDAMSINLIAENRYLRVNRSFIKLFGFPEQDSAVHSATGTGVWELPEELPSVYQLLRKQGKVVDLELTLRKKTGQTGVCLLSAEIVELGTKPIVLTTITDITAVKELKNEITRMERLNLVGQMAASISHEIRNPLTTVRGFLQLMQQNPDKSRSEEYLELMISELDRANSIITQYLSLAKNKPAHMCLQSLNKIIQTVYPLIKAMATVRGQDAKLTLGDIPSVVVDEEEIRQLLLNLVRNGTEAMDDDGLLTIRTFSEGSQVVLAVEDQGSGIEPELLDQIGIPFFTTKSDGNGLGLAVCFRIASRHNATISIDSDNSGTSIFVRFPVA